MYPMGRILLNSLLGLLSVIVFAAASFLTVSWPLGEIWRSQTADRAFIVSPLYSLVGILLFVVFSLLLYVVLKRRAMIASLISALVGLFLFATVSAVYTFTPYLDYYTLFLSSRRLCIVAEQHQASLSDTQKRNNEAYCNSFWQFLK